MLEIAFVFTYLVCCLVWLPFLQAITTWTLMFFCFLGIITMTRADRLLPALGWFARHPIRGAIILMGATFPAALAMQDPATSIMEIALYWVLFVLWLWLPNAWATSRQAGPDS